jgi:SAM-dependent methyltransferase
MTQDEQTVEYFDQHTPEYSLGRFRYGIEFIKSHAGAEKTLVDVGCGSGNILEYVRSETPVQNVCGIDVAPNYVVTTREKIGHAFLGSILDTDFVESLPEFDFVLLGAVLHHLVGNTRKQSKRNAETAIENALILTKPGGYLIIVEPTFYPSFAMDVLFYVKRLVTKLTPGRVQILGKWNNVGAPVVSYCTSEEFCRMVEHAGVCKIVGQEIKEMKIGLLMRAAGITRRTSTTIVVQRIGEL